MRHLLILAGLALCASALQAQEWVIGAGYGDFSRITAQDGAVFSLEYHAVPFYDNGRFSLGLAGAGEVHSTGDMFVGVGLAGLYPLNGRWFIEASVLSGYYRASLRLNSLGSEFEVRSLVGIGVTLASGAQVSLAFSHKSNASTAPANPGVNSLQLRLRRRF